MNDAIKKINVKKSFDKSRVAIESVNTMYREISRPRSLLNSTEYPEMKKRFSDLESDDKIFSKEEEEIIIALIAEIFFTVALIISLDNEIELDFSELIPVFDEQISFLFEIKTYLVKTLFKSLFDNMKRNQDSIEVVFPKNYNQLLEQRIKQYLEI